MKAKSVALFGLGIVAGLLLAPRKGSDSYSELKDRVNDLYLQARELDMDTIKDKIDDVRIEIAKMDFDRSKEIVSKQSQVIKDKLTKLITDLQENKDIQPAMESAINATEKAIIDVIDYIDENDLIDKTKEQAQKAYDKTTEYTMNLKEKTGEVADKTKEQAQKIYEKSTEYVDELKDEADDVIDDVSEKIEKKAKKSKKKAKED